MKLYPVEAAPRGDNTINGAYRLLSKLAEGGMGEVFLAEQIAVQRHVALKMLRRDKLAGLDLKEATERFEREALAMSRLRHPNTVQLIDFGVDGASGSYYLVLELLSGKALNVLLAEQGALTPTRAARIGVQIARALEEAHRHGIVHRDLKPDNVLLCEFDGASDFVKVLDFGIAISPATPMSKRLTSRSEILGSPYYMSPEQVRAQIVSFPSDVFSMGVLLYEALSGVPPFEGPSVVETMYRRLDGPPAPLRLARASDVRLEAAWDGLVRQMLKIEPEERPTMSEVRARLEDLRLWVPGARAPLGVKPAPAPRLAPEPEDPEALLASGLLETEDDEQPRGPATGAAARPASVARPRPKRRPTRARGPSLTPGVVAMNAFTTAPVPAEEEPTPPAADEPPPIPLAFDEDTEIRGMDLSALVAAVGDAEAAPADVSAPPPADVAAPPAPVTPGLLTLPPPAASRRGRRWLLGAVSAVAVVATVALVALGSGGEQIARAAGHALGGGAWPTTAPTAAAAPPTAAEGAAAARQADPFAANDAGTTDPSLELPGARAATDAPTDPLAADPELAVALEALSVAGDGADEPGEAVDAGAEPTVEQAAPALEAKTPPSRPKHVGKRPHKPKSKTAPPATLPGFRPDTGTRTVHE